jgi:hypothetical protein
MFVLIPNYSAQNFKEIDYFFLFFWKLTSEAITLKFGTGSLFHLALMTGYGMT